MYLLGNLLSGDISPQYEAPQVSKYRIKVMNFLNTGTCIK